MSPTATQAAPAAHISGLVGGRGQVPSGVYRGIVQYYLLAGDVHRLHRPRWVMETSMLRTLAGKHRSSISKMAAKHKARIETPHGPRTCFEARIERIGRQPLVARFGGIPLHRRRAADLSGWINKHRRCVRDYETLPESHEAMIYLPTIMVMSRRLARTGDW